MRPSKRLTWKDTQVVTIADVDGGALVSAPFGQFILSGTTAATAGGTLMDLVAEEVTAAAAAAADQSARASSRLMEALLAAAVDAKQLDLVDLFIDFAWAVGEMAAAVHPVPEYLETTEVTEGDGAPIRYHDIVQDNYAGTLQSPSVVRTFYPETR